MPIFDFICPVCKHTEEHLIKLSDTIEIPCPKPTHRPAVMELVKFSGTHHHKFTTPYA